MIVSNSSSILFLELNHEELTLKTEIYQPLISEDLPGMKPTSTRNDHRLSDVFYDPKDDSILAYDYKSSFLCFIDSLLTMRFSLGIPWPRNNN